MDFNNGSGSAVNDVDIRVEANLDTNVSVVPLSETSDPEVETEQDLDAEPEGEDEDVDMLDTTMASEDVCFPPDSTDRAWTLPVGAGDSFSFTSFQLAQVYPKLTPDNGEEVKTTVS